MGALSQRIPISRHGSTREMGIFWLKAPISEVMGNGSFFDPKTLFSRFWGFWPLCRADAFAIIDLSQSPENLLRLFFRKSLARQYPTSKTKNDLARSFSLQGPFAIIGPVQFCWPRRAAETWSTKLGFWERVLSVFPWKNSKTQSSLNFLQSGPRKFTKSDFSGLAPIRLVLIHACFKGYHPGRNYYKIIPCNNYFVIIFVIITK